MLHKPTDLQPTQPLCYAWYFFCCLPLSLIADARFALLTASDQVKSNSKFQPGFDPCPSPAVTPRVLWGVCWRCSWASLSQSGSLLQKSTHQAHQSWTLHKTLLACSASPCQCQDAPTPPSPFLLALLFLCTTTEALAWVHTDLITPNIYICSMLGLWLFSVYQKSTGTDWYQLERIQTSINCVQSQYFEIQWVYQNIFFI